MAAPYQINLKTWLAATQTLRRQGQRWCPEGFETTQPEDAKSTSTIREAHRIQPHL
jgi:hypothetical protein